MPESIDVDLNNPFSMLIVRSRGVEKTMFAKNLRCLIEKSQQVDFR